MKIAVVGATGLVGEMLLRVLEERAIPVSSVSAFANRPRTAAATFRGARLDVQPTSAEALRGFDAIFFAGGDEPSAELVPKISGNGCVVIDNSATFRLDPKLALIVPEVNGAALRDGQKVFPVANCTAIILSVALGPIARSRGPSKHSRGDVSSRQRRRTRRLGRIRGGRTRAERRGRGAGAALRSQRRLRGMSFRRSATSMNAATR